MFQRNVIAILLALSLTGCGTPATPVPQASAPIVGPVVPVGSSEIRDLTPTTETVSNCGGGNGTVVKHPSMTVLTSHTIEWEVGGQIGAGVTIGEGVVPGGVNLSGAFDSHITSGSESGIEQSTAWDLPAEPNTIMEYTLAWSEIWQSGNVEVRLADQSVIQVNVRYRTGIQSDIVGQRQRNCDSSQGVSPTSEPPTKQPPTQIAVVPTATSIPSPTQSPNTPTDSILEVGQSWRKDNVLLTLANSKFYIGDFGFECEIGPKFYLENLSSSTIIVSVRLSEFSLQDNLGSQWIPTAVSAFEGCPNHNDSYTEEVEPGKRFTVPGYDSWYVGFQGSINDPAVTYLIVTVNDLYHFTGARWKVPINK